MSPTAELQKAAPPTITSPPANPRAVHGALLVVSFCFATFPVAGKWAMFGFEPRAISVWRVVVAALVLMTLAYRKHPNEMRMSGRDLLQAFWLSLLGVSVNQVLYIEGLKRASATNAGLFMCLIPVLTYGISVLFGREALVLRKVFGLFLAMTGVAVLFVFRRSNQAADSLLGYVLVVLNATSYSVYLVLAKPMLKRKPALVVIAWVFLFGAAVVPLMSLDVAWAPEASGRAWVALAWILLFPTITSYGLNTWALERTEASIVGIYVCLQPIINMFLAALLLSERLKWPSAVAALLVLLGVYFVTRARRRPADLLE